MLYWCGSLGTQTEQMVLRCDLQVHARVSWRCKERQGDRLRGDSLLTDLVVSALVHGAQKLSKDWNGKP